jgi:Kdo2-lipid IVA lauroyltransferase/acyltransferase
MSAAKTQGTEVTWRNFLGPRYWLTWGVVFLLRMLALLPHRAGLSVGAGIGVLLYRMAVKRRRVTQVNIKLCFPELTLEQQQELVKEVFKANAMGFVETAWAYWGDHHRILEKTTLKGFELLEEALSHHRGVILLGGHFSTLDLGGVMFSKSGNPINTVYRKHNNTLMDYIISKGRLRSSRPIERKNMRKILRELKENRCVWYAPDQDFGKSGAVFVPFFGQAAATIVATTRMTKLNDSPILMLAHYRNKDNSGYTMELTPVPGFPTDDETKDAALVNQVLETAIRKAPEQYMWVHKRFKTQPDGNQKWYKEAGC